MANSVDPDQLASSDLDLHCLQKQDISVFSRTRVNSFFYHHFSEKLKPGIKYLADHSHEISSLTFMSDQGLYCLYIKQQFLQVAKQIVQI